MSDTTTASDTSNESLTYGLSIALQREVNQLRKELAILRAAQSYQYSPIPDNRWMRLCHRLATQLYAKPEDTKTPEDRIVLDMYSQLAGEPNEP